MESEKAKEIKKALEDNANYEHHNKLGYIDGYKCKTVDYADILTLINELESENKRLNKAINSVQKGFDNGEFISKDCQTKTLKQFAEKLKNKLFEFFQDNEELDGKISVGPLYVNVIGVELEDGTIISLGLIDKLLKECLND